jgi:hypothetical protein
MPIQHDDLERRTAILMAAICRANIRAIGMQAENMQRAHQGEAMAYPEQAFRALIDEEGLGWNDVMERLRP